MSILFSQCAFYLNNAFCKRFVTWKIISFFGISILFVINGKVPKSNYLNNAFCFFCRQTVCSSGTWYILNNGLKKIYRNICLFSCIEEIDNFFFDF